MTKLLAGVFAGFAMLWGSLFGGHFGMPNSNMGTSTPPHMGMASSTWMGGGMGTSTPGHMMMGMKPAVVGQVVSIDGTTLTVSGHAGMGSATTTYTIDASNANVIKGTGPGKSATSTVADINVGDNVSIQGTVSGTNVTATTIFDGIMSAMRRGPMRPPHMPNSGQPPVPTPTPAM